MVSLDPTNQRICSPQVETGDFWNIKCIENHFLLYILCVKNRKFRPEEKLFLRAHWSDKVGAIFLYIPGIWINNMIPRFYWNPIKFAQIRHRKSYKSYRQFFFARYLKSNWKLGTITILVSIYIRWDKLNFKLVRNTKTILFFSNWINGETCITGKRS